MATDFSVFSGRRILVTGHTGFKGAWLSIWLKQLGARVQGIALDPHTMPSLYAMGGRDAVADDHRCDIRMYEDLQTLVERLQPEMIFHLAAQPLVRQSYAAARGTFDTNVMGTVHVLECARHVDSIQCVVHVSTDKCYEPLEKAEGYTEGDPLGGHDPYSSSKAAAELVVQSYIRSFCEDFDSLLIASGRAGNVIGGGDWAEDRIIPDCIRALQSGSPIPVRNPASVRPWQHVLEALSGYLALGASLLGGHRECMGAWNFGPRPDNVKTVEDLANALVRVWGEGTWRHEAEQAAPHEAKLLTLVSTKAEQGLGWRSRWDFDATIQRTAKWYQRLGEGTDVCALCLADIEDYMSASL